MQQPPVFVSLQIAALFRVRGDERVPRRRASLVADEEDRKMERDGPGARREMVGTT
jgi:hypothetical protein